jgi:hypothetical protein
MNTENFALPKVFPLRRKWKLFFVRLFLMLSILMIAIFAIPLSIVWPIGIAHFGVFFVFFCTGIPLLYILIVGLFIYYIVRKIKHVAIAEGIIFTSLGYSIYTPWSNIRGIQMRRFGAANSLALILQQPAIKGHIRDGIRRGNAVMQNPLIMRRRDVFDAIPILFDTSENWQESDLFAYIMHYAPQVLSTQNT